MTFPVTFQWDDGSQIFIMEKWVEITKHTFKKMVVWSSRLLSSKLKTGGTLFLGKELLSSEGKNLTAEWYSFSLFFPLENSPALQCLYVLKEHTCGRRKHLSGVQRCRSANSRIYGFLPNCNYIPRSFSVLP